MKISRAFYEQSTVQVARQLLGKYLVRKHPVGKTVGRIVETEAYVGPKDLTCHASRGRTARTEIMFAAAVLIRALEPVEGIQLMKERRHTKQQHNLASGPGKLCQSFAIDKSLNGTDLCRNIIYVEDCGGPPPKILALPRIGVDYAGKWKDKPWRFLIRGNEFVSRP